MREAIDKFAAISRRVQVENVDRAKAGLHGRDRKAPVPNLRRDVERAVEIRHAALIDEKRAALAGFELAGFHAQGRMS